MNNNNKKPPPLPSVSSQPTADIFLTYFAAQVHLAFNNTLRPTPKRIVEVSRRLGITRQQCLLLLNAGRFGFGSPLVAFPSLASEDDYRQYALASPDDYCVVAVSNVIEKIKEFPASRKEVFDKLPDMLTAFDQTLTTEVSAAKPFWNYKSISLFLRSFFLQNHVTTSSGGVVAATTHGPRRIGCAAT